MSKDRDSQFWLEEAINDHDHDRKNSEAGFRKPNPSVHERLT
jgi:hypothetical protein